MNPHRVRSSRKTGCKAKDKYEQSMVGRVNVFPSPQPIINSHHIALVEKGIVTVDLSEIDVNECSVFRRNFTLIIQEAPRSRNPSCLLVVLEEDICCIPWSLVGF